MAEPDRRPVTVQELLVSSLAQTDALAQDLCQAWWTNRTLELKVLISSISTVIRAGKQATKANSLNGRLTVT